MGNIQNSNISDDFILTQSSNSEILTIPDYNKNMAQLFLDKITDYLKDHEDKDFLVNCGKRYFPKESISDGPETQTLKDVLYKVPALAKSLYKRGLRKSDVVHLVIGNRSDIFVPVFATFLCQGIISISVDSVSTETLRSALQDTKPRFVVCTNKTLSRVKDLEAEILNMDTDMENLIKEGASLDVEVPVQSSFDLTKEIAVILWSSGTTGKPKGIPMTVATFWGSLHNPPRAKGNTLISSHFAHISGFCYSTCWTINFDACTYHFISSDDVDHLGVKKILDVCREVPMFSMMLSSHHCVYMAEMIKNGEVDPSSKFDDVYFITPAGSFTYPTIEEDFGQLFTSLICVPNIYGLTESGGGMLLSTSQKSNGGVMSKTEIYIRDTESNERLGPNKVGELMFRRSLPITPGYLNNPEESAKVFEADGWCHSGDLFRYSETGEFFFESRMKEMLKSQGSHVYPLELENLIKGMDSKIIEVGISSTTKKGLIGGIIVHKKGSTLDVKRIREEINAKVDDYKRLEGPIYLSTEPLPRNPMGKILRSVLTKKYNDLID